MWKCDELFLKNNIFHEFKETLPEH